MDGERPRPWRDDAGPLEHGQEAARRLARGSGQLGDVGLGDGDEHVAVAPAPSVARLRRRAGASTAATRLWTVWKDWRARRSLVSRRRRPSATTSLTAISGCSRSRRRMSAPRIAIASSCVERLDGRRAPLVVEHRQLAEDVARAEVRERDRRGRRRARASRGRGRCGRRSTCRRRRPRGRRPGRASKLPRHGDLGDPREVRRRRASRRRAPRRAARRRLVCSLVGSDYHTGAAGTPDGRGRLQRRSAVAAPHRGDAGEPSAATSERPAGPGSAAAIDQHAGADLEDAPGVVERVARGCQRPPPVVAPERRARPCDRRQLDGHVVDPVARRRQRRRWAAAISRGVVQRACSERPRSWSRRPALGAAPRAAPARRRELATSRRARACR